MRAALVLGLLLALAGCSSTSGGFGVERGSSASGGGVASSTGASTSASGASTGSSGSSTGSSASSTGTSGGSSGSTGDGPRDAGIYRYDAGPPVLFCHIIQGGRPLDIGVPDGGCLPQPSCVGTAVPLEPEVHVPEPEAVAYLSEPPPSGPHWPCWAPWGTGHALTALPAERFVHNLEHGGVVLLYRCAPDAGLPDGGSCGELAAPLVAYASDGGPAAPAGDRRYLVTARPGISATNVALAWGWRLELDPLDLSALDCFARAHLGAAPENLGSDPSPAACPQSYLP